ncbi:MAG: hypothetical protein V4649_02090 [Bacteroidota bacterium]
MLIILAAAAACFPVISYGQSNVEVYGQNRIQHRKFEWKFFDTKHFRVYHYDRTGRQLGRYVAEEAENNIAIVEKKLGGQFPARFDIILYNSYDEYRQSNVGLKEEAQEIGNSRAGSLNLVGDKLVVYFTGEHNDLRHQIRSGMSRVVMQRMIFGDNFKKMVKNALLLNLPPWVTDGYIAYLVDGWDAKSNSEWKGILDAQPKTGFNEFSEQYPELAGKAFWKFISDQYGTGAVKSLLYSMQQKTSLNKAMKDSLNLKMKVTKAYDSCIKFYKNVYEMDAKRQEQPDSTHGLIALKVPKDNTIIRNIRVSPNGSDIVYVAWRNGQFTVYSQKTAGGQAVSTLLEGGRKDLTDQIDPNYPMMTWSNNGQKLAILYKKGHQTILRIYSSIRGRIENYVIQPNRFDRVLGMCFMQDDDKLVFSAIKKSQTDLYMFTIKGSKMTNITDDEWDDVAPEFISGGSRTGILFLSNRTQPNMNVPLGVNQLPVGPMNIFFYNTKTMRPELLQCTDIKKGHITLPIQYGFDNFAYLYDSNGVSNKYIILFARNRNNLDSAYSVPVTNYTSSILSHQYNIASDDVADVVQVGDKFMVYFHQLQMPGVNAPVKTLYPTILSVEKPEAKPKLTAGGRPVVPGVQTEEEPMPSRIKGGTAFQTEFSDTATAPAPKKRAVANKIFGSGPAAPDSSMLTEMTDSAYVKMKPSPYRLSFKPNFFSIKLDNSVLFNQYQSIATNGGQYNNQPMGALTTVALNDLLENHRITAGFQLPLDLSSSNYFLQYQNFSKRLDWGLLFLRREAKDYKTVVYYDSSGRGYPFPQLFKMVTNMIQSDFSYPLDRVRSIRFHTALRQDRLIQKITNKLSLDYDFPDPDTYTSMSRLEYVFDNTITPTLNISNGTKFKFYGEMLYGLNKANKSCYVFGLDIRHYQKLYKNFILANRIAYAHSDGNAKVQYLLGGVDNWVGPQSDVNATQPPAPDYGFQALSTSLRGYKQYARTGNNFAVLTTELRLPVLTTFMKRPIQSAVLKNLQLVAFADAGSAWKGVLPTAENTSQPYIFPQYAAPGQLNNVFLTLTVPNSSGLALGYGAGLRTSLFGYFIRLDAAWNIDGSPTPMMYFAIGTDF